MNDASHSLPPDNSAAGQSHAGDAANAPPPKTSARKPRSTTERNIVWGVIAVLLVVLGLELRAHFGFKRAYDTLSAAMEADSEQEDEQYILTEEDVASQMNGVAPVKSEPLSYLDHLASRVDTYEWRGPLRTRSLYVYYGVGEDNPDVVSIALEKDRSSASYFESIGADNAQSEAPATDETPDEEDAGDTP